MPSDYYIDPATGDTVYADGDIALTAGVENLLYLAIAVERGTYWANPALGSDIKALVRAGETWPRIVDAARRALDDLQRRGLLTVIAIDHAPDSHELIIHVEELAEPHRLEVKP
jgi:hypothetical protein